MRKILALILIIVSINSFGQNPANYQYRVVYERLRGLMPDSVLHIPRYNGVPSGLRGGSSNHDGAIAMDTLNGNFYIYHNTVWIRMAKFSELIGYTDEQAQDAVGAMINSTLSYVDATPLLGINLGNANTWTADQSVPDEAYDATGWNGSVEVPTKNAIRDKIETLSALNLQSVTDVGNTTTNQILAGDRVAARDGSTVKAELVTEIIGADVGGNLGLVSAGAGTNQAILKAQFGYTASRAFTFPNYSGTVAAHPTISGQAGKVLAVNGGETALEWIAAGGGGGNVTKVGTPANNQVGVWTGDGTIEGTNDFMFDGTTLTVGSIAVPTISSTNTFTNKRWTARVGSTTSSGTPTINTDNVDIYKLTAQTADITSFTTNLSGTPVDGDILEIQVTGTASRAITWGASFVSTTTILPTSTSGTITLTVIFQYYTTSSYGNNKWHCVSYY